MNDVESICFRNHANVKQAEEMDRAYRAAVREQATISKKQAKDRAELRNLRLACWFANVCTGLLVAMCAMYAVRGFAFPAVTAALTAAALVGASVLFEERTEDIREGLK